MPTPPAAYARWKSTRAVVTRERWLRPSYVAALRIRLRRVRGPIRPGEKTSGTDAADSALSRTCSTFQRLPQLLDGRGRPDHVVEHPLELARPPLPRGELAVGPVSEVVQ